MCQLLGVSYNVPTDTIFSPESSRRHGGITDHHADGFDIGFFEERGVHLFHNDEPNASSPVADLVCAYQIKSESVTTHIRKTSQGQTLPANTHPFMREMQGEYWLFVYGGHLIGSYPERGEYYHAADIIGSGRVLCYILSRLRNRFAAKPDAGTLFDAIAVLTHEIRRHGLFNFVMSNGDCLFVCASMLLHYVVHRALFDKARLLDDDVMVDFAEAITLNDRVVAIAILPLTRDRAWSQLTVDELAMLYGGNIVRNDKPRNPAYMSAEEGLEIACTAGVVV